MTTINTDILTKPTINSQNPPQARFEFTTIKITDAQKGDTIRVTQTHEGYKQVTIGNHLQSLYRDHSFDEVNIQSDHLKLKDLDIQISNNQKTVVKIQNSQGQTTDEQVIEPQEQSKNLVDKIKEFPVKPILKPFGDTKQIGVKVTFK